MLHKFLKTMFLKSWFAVNMGWMQGRGNQALLALCLLRLLLRLHSALGENVETWFQA
jgi:hypothetical protein